MCYGCSRLRVSCDNSWLQCPPSESDPPDKAMCRMSGETILASRSLGGRDGAERAAGTQMHKRVHSCCFTVGAEISLCPSLADLQYALRGCASVFVSRSVCVCMYVCVCACVDGAWSEDASLGFVRSCGAVWQKLPRLSELRWAWTTAQLALPALFQLSISEVEDGDADSQETCNPLPACSRVAAEAVDLVEYLATVLLVHGGKREHAGAPWV